ncbi:hypothetical protein WI984_002081 [Klebsiella aerogenes]|nr:hypothetical protein [Klebsiella aerogenes]
MQEFKGTSGPWRVNTIGKHWNNPALVHLEVTFGTDGECICDTVYRREDADLIAAAPELLESLQELFAHYKELADSGDAGNWKLEDEPVGKKAMAAIDKALGK